MAKLSLALVALAHILTAAWARDTGSSFSRENYEDFLKHGTEGEITVFRQSYWDNGKENTKARTTIPRDTCVSANFTLDSNVVIRRIGVCPGGRNPYLALYPSQNCTGAHSHPRWSFASPRQLSKAVWGASSDNIEPPVGGWSMVLRCLDMDEASKAEGAEDFLHISLPDPPPPPPEKKPKKPSKTASVSDSACPTKKYRMPRFLFQHPRPDVCLNIEPGRQLKIYHTAMCDDGNWARFARYKNKGCSGDPETVEDVTEHLLATNGFEKCIAFDEDEWNSYSFICSGDISQEEVGYDLFPEEKKEGEIRLHYSNYNNKPDAKSASKPRSGGKVGLYMALAGAGVFLLFVLCGVLYLWTNIFSRAFMAFLSLFQRRDEGRIAL
jgi:hypothetical protein